MGGLATAIGNRRETAEKGRLTALDAEKKAVSTGWPALMLRNEHRQAGAHTVSLPGKGWWSRFFVL